MKGVKKVFTQTLLCDKFVFENEEAARNFASANDFKTDAVTEDDSFWMFQQRPRADFKLAAFGEGRDFRVVSLQRGAFCLVGMLNDDAKAAEVLDGKDGAGKPSFRFTKVDDEKRLVTGPVLVPDQVDLQGDFEFEEDIEATAHKFMEDAQNIGVQHRVFGKDIRPVESWLLRESWMCKTAAAGIWKIYPKGTWMLTTKVNDDDTWRKVRNGELTGYSIGFRGTREAAS